MPKPEVIHDGYAYRGVIHTFCGEFIPDAEYSTDGVWVAAQVNCRGCLAAKRDGRTLADVRTEARAAAEKCPPRWRRWLRW